MGRNKKRGERYPSGKLKPTGEPVTGAHWQRLRDVGPRILGDPKVASEVGRLVFCRELTPQQAATADRIAVIYGTFERQHSIRRHTRSPSYEMGFRGDRSAFEELLGPEARADRDKQLRAIEDAFRALQQSLICYPRDLRDNLETLCVDGGALPPGWLPLIRGALDEIAKDFGTSKSRKLGRKAKPRKAGRAEQVIPSKSPASPPAPKDPSIEKIAYLAMLKAMRPDLDEEARNKAWDLFMAMKDRERFNRSIKEKP